MRSTTEIETIAPVGLRLTPSQVGAFCRNAAVAERAIAHHSGRSDDYYGQQARRFARACGKIPVNGVHFGACWLIRSAAGEARIIVDNIPGFDHRITDADAKRLEARIST